MTMYKIIFSPEAETDLTKLKKSEPASFKKAVKLLNELIEHPKTALIQMHVISGNVVPGKSVAFLKK